MSQPPHLPEAAASMHVMAKPSGSTCNIDCKYCFFLSKEALYPDSKHRMPDATMEAYIRQLIESHRTPTIIIAWQGGEPTLMGLDFFRKAVAIAEEYCPPHQTLEHTFQTNGVALDDEWCKFFKERKFLVGISIDGPQPLHDANRVLRNGNGSFDLVMKGLNALRRAGVLHNILCTVHRANQDYGRQVYRFFRDQLGATFIQFIPIIERATEQTIQIANKGWSESIRDKRVFYSQVGSLVTERSVTPEGYGRFLIDIFEEWVRHDVGRVFVQLFDVTLEANYGRHLLCIHAPTCGQGLALEHNGDLYSCDHFVEPGYLLGNIHQTHMLALATSAQQRKFGQDKRDLLTGQCRSCPIRNFCHGGCPKDRFMPSDGGEPGHNYLCAGFYAFFSHVQPVMKSMQALLDDEEAPALVMTQLRAQDAQRDPYSACPCGGGKKFKFCHGAKK
jgi:uncharacterized protein